MDTQNSTKTAILISALICSFAGTTFAQEGAVPEKFMKPRSEAQLVSETICPAMQDEDTYKLKGMAVYKKIVAGDDGWVFRTGTDFREDFSLHPQTVVYMKRLQDAFEYAGITFVYLIPPTRGITEGNFATGKDPESVEFLKKRPQVIANYKKMIDTLKAAGINVIGLTNTEEGRSYFYKRDHHWNPEGAKLAAETVAGFIKSKPVYADLVKTPYITKDMGEYDYDGPIGEVVQPICKLTLMAEKTKKFTTELKTTADDSSALFDEKGFPEVVLVGTSNSAADPSVANFEGFLKEALSVDIYNASIIGAGIDAPIQAYLNSKTYREHKPKVVIWETPGYYNHNFMHSRIYRQVIPAVLGDCKGNSVAERKASPIKSLDETVISGLDGKKINGSGYYLTLNFEKNVKNPINLSINYKNWTDTYKTSRPPRYPYDGEYFMLLKDTKAGEAKSVKINLKDELVGTSLEARICKLPAKLVLPPKAATKKK